MVRHHHEGIHRSHAVFLIFIAFMGTTFINLLRDYHATQYGGSAAGDDFLVHGDPSLAANEREYERDRPQPIYNDKDVGAREMTEQLQHQLEKTVAETLAATLQQQQEANDKDEANTETTTTPKRLNVALFYADDWTMKVLGKLDKLVKTPNIDEMADKGMLFTNNCVTTSVCWSSRSTLATGTYLAVHKHTMPFSEAKFETDHWSETLYPMMKNAGYFTGLFGKWHKLEVGNEMKAAFDRSKVYYGHHWEKRDGEMRHVTELNQADSLEFLDQWEAERRRKLTEDETSPHQQPFFLTSAFFATHARDGEWPSYQCTNATRRSVYPDDLEIPKAKTATEEHYNNLPFFLKGGGNEGRMRWKKRFDPSNFQVSIKDMYAMATEVDDAIGAIIAKIKHLGEYDQTVLIFTTDNGNMHGEHGLAEKWYPFEESLRVPLVIQDPRMPEERIGTVSEAWTLNVDLTPTILAVAGLDPSDFMQGRDIADLYLHPSGDNKIGRLSNTEMIETVDWRRDWFYEFNLGVQNNASDHPWKNFIDASFALVTDEWKYVVWPQHKYEQLFHRSVDPFDEWDLLNKIMRPKMKLFRENNKTIEKLVDTSNSNGPFEDTVQTTVKMYNKMKARYKVLKDKAQNGERI